MLGCISVSEAKLQSCALDHPSGEGTSLIKYFRNYKYLTKPFVWKKSQSRKPSRKHNRWSQAPTSTLSNWCEAKETLFSLLSELTGHICSEWTMHSHHLTISAQGKEQRKGLGKTVTPIIKSSVVFSVLVSTPRIRNLIALQWTAYVSTLGLNLGWFCFRRLGQGTGLINQISIMESKVLIRWLHKSAWGSRTQWLHSNNVHANWENMFLWWPHAKIQIYKFFFIPKNSLNICHACLCVLGVLFLSYGVEFCFSAVGPGQVPLKWILIEQVGTQSRALGVRKRAGRGEKQPTHTGSFLWGQEKQLKPKSSESHCSQSSQRASEWPFFMFLVLHALWTG